MIEIAGRPIGQGHSCYIIAEVGINHNGDIALAKQLIHGAASAGCDAVKFQTYRVEHLVSSEAPMADYQIRNTGFNASQADLLAKCQLDLEAHKILLQECERAGIAFLSTPFDLPSLELLVKLQVPALKVSSGDLTNVPFLERIGSSRLPVILSTGMANLDEIKMAVDVFKAVNGASYALLHCVSAYPATPEDCNLRVIPEMARYFQVPVGFSDHTTGIDIALASVAMGAAIVEKHITIDRSLQGADHAASIEIDELQAMVRGIRRIHEALGDGIKMPKEEELRTARVARKSLHVLRAVQAGEPIIEGNLIALRPGTGIPPSHLPSTIGRLAAQDIPAGAILTETMLK